MAKTKRRHSHSKSRSSRSSRSRSRRGGDYTMMGTQPQPTALDAISSTASQGIQKAKQGIITGFDSAKNWLGLGTSSTPTSYGGKRRSRRHRHGRSKRGGSVVRAYNTYVDSSTRYATPVTGYQTAKPHNWVGGKRRSHRRRTSKSCWWK